MATNVHWLSNAATVVVALPQSVELKLPVVELKLSAPVLHVVFGIINPAAFGCAHLETTYTTVAPLAWDIYSE